jgi:hypothetical protein
VRSLIVRWTAVAAALAGLLTGMATAALRAPWTLVIVRASVAFALVAAIGFGFGLILMRTALRRHIEEARAVEASRRARGNRSIRES